MAETDQDATTEQAQQRPAPTGLVPWAGQRVKVHTMGGRVKALEGVLTDVAGDGLVITEDDADWWVPREMVQAVQRNHETD